MYFVHVIILFISHDNIRLRTYVSFIIFIYNATIFFNILLLRKFITSKLQFSTYTKVYADKDQQSHRTVDEMTNSPVDRNLTNDQMFDKLKETKKDCYNCMFSGQNIRDESSCVRTEIRDFYRDNKKYLDSGDAKALEQRLNFDANHLASTHVKNAKSKEEEQELSRLYREESMLFIAKQKLTALKDKVPAENRSKIEDLESRIGSLNSDFSSVYDGLTKSTAKAEKLREILLSRGVSLTTYGENFDDIDMDYSDPF